MSAAATASHGGTPTLPCNTTVTATGPAGFTSDSIAVTVNQAPALIVPALLGAVGGGLQLGGFSVTLTAAQQSVVRVHVESSDASRVLVASSPSAPGAGAIDIDIPAGMTAASFYVQGVDWTSGTSSAGSADLTFSAAGFTSDIASVNYVQPALEIDSLPTTTPAAAPNHDFRVRVGIAAAGGASLTAFQPRRPGGQPLSVTVTNSNAAVAQIDKIGGAADLQVQVADIAVGASATPFNASGGLEFDPRGAGTTVVSAAIPGFMTTTAGARTVTVTPSPKITMAVHAPGDRRRAAERRVRRDARDAAAGRPDRAPDLVRSVARAAGTERDRARPRFDRRHCACWNVGVQSSTCRARTGFRDRAAQETTSRSTPRLLIISTVRPQLTTCRQLSR